MQKLEDQVDIEWRCLDSRTEPLRPSGQYPERLEAWKNGQTGVPMVDACMLSKPYRMDQLSDARHAGIVCLLSSLA